MECFSWETNGSSQKKDIVNSGTSQLLSHLRSSSRKNTQSTEFKGPEVKPESPEFLTGRRHGLPLSPQRTWHKAGAQDHLVSE